MQTRTTSLKAENQALKAENKTLKAEKSVITDESDAKSEQIDRLRFELCQTQGELGAAETFIDEKSNMFEFEHAELIKKEQILRKQNDDRGKIIFALNAKLAQIRSGALVSTSGSGTSPHEIGPKQYPAGTVPCVMCKKLTYERGHSGYINPRIAHVYGNCEKYNPSYDSMRGPDLRQMLNRKRSREE